MVKFYEKTTSSDINVQGIGEGLASAFSLYHVPYLIPDAKKACLGMRLYSSGVSLHIVVVGHGVVAIFGLFH